MRRTSFMDDTYGVESKLMLLACVEDADLWLEEKTGRLGEAWITWSTRWPTDDGRIRVPSCTNREFLMNAQRNSLRGQVVSQMSCFSFIETRMQDMCLPLQSWSIILQICCLTKEEGQPLEDLELIKILTDKLSAAASWLYFFSIKSEFNTSYDKFSVKTGMF